MASYKLNAAIAELNNQYRNKPMPTDVLSFPLGENGVYDTDENNGCKMLGDIVISISQALVKRLQGYITENYYPSTKEILNSLGEMYAAGGEFAENIDKAGGEGTAVFAQQAIAIYCR